jgi:exodeoxyribonuclease VII large subunit
MSTEVNYNPETGEILESGSNAEAMSVGELSQALKRTIEDRFGFVRVRGEISGYRGPHSSGHCYFSIKDDTAKLDAVIWRGTFNKLRSKLAEGLEVIASGKVTSYPGKSSYQIVIENVEPAGIGALMAVLEERKKKLSAEGLFDPSRKRGLPYLPDVIGIITSPTGAVIRDILHRLGDRFPRHVQVWPVRVQGETAAREVAAAIAGFNAMERRPDLLIVARGGGSIEDLWPFNEEVVVRAVAASIIPLISAVGHETDTTLIDFVSDWRAPTPTAAAERAVPVRSELLAALASLEARQYRAIGRLTQHARLGVQSAARGLLKPADVLAIAWQRLDAVTGRLPPALRGNLQRHAIALSQRVGRLSLGRTADRRRLLQSRCMDVAGRLARGMKLQIDRRRDRFASETKLFAMLNYQSTLLRGYAIVRDGTGRPLKTAADAVPASRIEIEFADGRIDAEIGRPTRQPLLI